MSKHASLNVIDIISNYAATREIVALAEHQLEILKRRLPNYGHSIHVLGSHGLIITSSKNYLFQISFRSRSVEILLSIGDGEETSDTTDESIILDYADPKFTDDAISDIIEEWEAGHA